MSAKGNPMMSPEDDPVVILVRRVFDADDRSVQHSNAATDARREDKLSRVIYHEKAKQEAVDEYYATHL